MKQYIDLMKRIVDTGVVVDNKRTGSKCLTVIDANLVYTPDVLPLVTTRKSYWKSAIAELIGYLRGYDSADKFREIGCNTWNANANNNEAWLNNKHRKGVDDMGRVYGVQGRNWVNQFGEQFDQVKKVQENLKQGIDDRGEIITFYNPAEFEYGCLRPCMHTHTFSLLNDTLHLTSNQRSADVPLGLNFNSVQCYAFLMMMSATCGYKQGNVYHKIVNAHIYENQLELVKEQIKREPYPLPILKLKTRRHNVWEYTVDDFELIGYQHHEAIDYPFTV